MSVGRIRDWLAGIPPEDPEKVEIEKRNKMRDFAIQLRKEIDEKEKERAKEASVWSAMMRESKGNPRSPYARRAQDIKKKMNAIDVEIGDRRVKLEKIDKTLEAHHQRRMNTEWAAMMKDVVTTVQKAPTVTRDELDKIADQVDQYHRETDAMNGDLASRSAPTQSMFDAEADFRREYAAMMSEAAGASASAAEMSDEMAASAMEAALRSDVEFVPPEFMRKSSFYPA